MPGMIAEIPMTLPSCIIKMYLLFGRHYYSDFIIIVYKHLLTFFERFVLRSRKLSVRNHRFLRIYINYLYIQQSLCSVASNIRYSCSAPSGHCGSIGCISISYYYILCTPIYFTFNVQNPSCRNRIAARTHPKLIYLHVRVYIDAIPWNQHQMNIYKYTYILYRMRRTDRQYCT